MDTVDFRIRRLGVRPVELRAVEAAALRVRAYWATPVTKSGYHAGSAFTGPSADDVLRKLGVGWRREIQLLDLALMVAAQDEGRELTKHARWKVSDAA